MNQFNFNLTNTTEIDSNEFVKTCTLFLLSFVFIIGTIGNLLVLGVFIHHHLFPQSSLKNRRLYFLKRRDFGTTEYKKTNETNLDTHSESSEQLFSQTIGTPSFFILVLACVDLIVCCVVIPIVFYMEYVDMQPNSDIWCKTYTFLTVCNIMFSSLLIIAIALDRYLAICHPFYNILNMKRAKYLTIGLAIFCIIYGILAAVHSKLSYKNNNSTVKQCYETVELDASTQTEKIMYIIIQKGNTASFVLSIVCVLVLYSLILKVVLRTHQKTREQSIKGIFNYNANNKSNLLTVNMYSDQQHLAPVDNYLSTSSGVNKTKTNKTKLRCSFKGIVENKLWQELRSASVLFVIAIVYIIVFAPALLIANKVIELNIFAFNTYFLNNVSNPLIYCFMSKAFRKRLKFMLFGLCIKRQNVSENKLFFSAPPGRARPRLNSQNVK